jgi:hypothetical protein
MFGAAVAIVPALAAGTPAPSEVKLEVNENCHLPEWPCWNVKGNNPEDIGQIQPFTIAQGGTISFEDNDSKAPTDVLWKGAAPSCAPGVPSTPKTSWSSTCTFANAGEYEFESQDLFDDGTFNYTKYKVIVEAPGGGGTTSTTTTTTTSTTTTSTTTTPTPTPTTTTPTTTMPTTTTSTPTTPTATTSTQPSGGAPTATTSGSIETPSPPGEGSPLATLALANAQHGDAVHGTVQIPAADGGARLEVELLAQGASLAKVKRGGSSRVGRLVRSAPAGTVSFTVALDAQAKRALRHHKLALTVKIVLTPKHGAAITLTRKVVVR